MSTLVRIFPSTVLLHPDDVIEQGDYRWMPEHPHDDEADRLLVALVTAEYAPKDGDGDYQNYAAYGAWLDALAAARAYIARKGLA